MTVHQTGAASTSPVLCIIARVMTTALAALTCVAYAWFPAVFFLTHVLFGCSDVWTQHAVTGQRLRVPKRFCSTSSSTTTPEHLGLLHTGSSEAEVRAIEKRAISSARRGPALSFL